MRELLHTLERALLLAEEPVLDAEDASPVSRSARRLGVARSTLRWQVPREGLRGLTPED